MNLGFKRYEVYLTMHVGPVLHVLRQKLCLKVVKGV